MLQLFKNKKTKPEITDRVRNYFEYRLSSIPGLHLARCYDPDQYGFNDSLGLLFISYKDKYYIKVEPVSNYSDISGIKDYTGWIFKLCKGAYVYRIYTNISDVIRDFDTFHDITAIDPYDLEIKQRKLEDKLEEIKLDFE